MAEQPLTKEEALELANERFRELLMGFFQDIAYQEEPGKYNWFPATALVDQCSLGEPFPDANIYGWLSEGCWYPSINYHPGMWAYKQARDALTKEILSGDNLVTQLYFIGGSGKENIGKGGKSITCGICSLYEGKTLNEAELEEAISMGLFHPNCVHYAIPVIETNDVLDIVQHTGE